MKLNIFNGGYDFCILQKTEEKKIGVMTNLLLFFVVETAQDFIKISPQNIRDP